MVLLEINVRNDRRLVEIWLSNAEKRNPELRVGLKSIYGRYKRKKYLVAVFESGERDLYQGVLELLIYNKRRAAELEVEREKKQRLSGIKQ